MNTLKWQDEYSLGIKELDDQHRNLLQFINILIEKKDDSPESGALSEDIILLIHYAYTHFATEERYLIEAKFPDLHQHIIEHVDFIQKTLSMALESGKYNNESRQNLLEFLKNWYSLHVLGTDRRYIPYLKKP
jgi:hemerythrin